ncbi:MAG: manganese efflux pump MntP family protein [Elusimicrobium sp.]|jgi:putative Mn2+ efflux pump MntP|nr:manganese efflux pump MntP family protein [Elusimicrobium sp.]
MGYITVLLVALSLTMDNFAVSLACGCGPDIKNKDIVKCGSFFALAHIIMFSVGWFGGELAERYIDGYDHWAAFFLLLFIGGKMIKEAFSEKEECFNIFKNTREIILVSLATSMDALAVGLSLSFAAVNFTFAAASTAVFVFITTFLGFKLGRKLNAKFGKRAEIAGGIVLIGIGLKILLDGIK